MTIKSRIFCNFIFSIMGFSSNLMDFPLCGHINGKCVMKIVIYIYSKIYYTTSLYRRFNSNSVFSFISAPDLAHINLSVNISLS